jgi:cellobiose phosphorylase
VHDFWEDVISRGEIKTDSKQNDELVKWLIYQTISCRIWARTSFYQCGGAFGFRDQLQDVINIADILPELAREHILLSCARQYKEGDVFHWWHEENPPRGVRTKFSDDRLWLPWAVFKYIEKTGDEGILDEHTHFLESEILGSEEPERYESPKTSSECASVYEHAARAIDISLRFGKSGLPLFLGGDWNDGMNKVGERGLGESVFMAFFMINVLNGFIPICEKKGDAARAKKYREVVKNLVKNIENNAWDGEWFLRGFYDSGEKLGSAENEECKIDGLVQAWSVLSGNMWGGKEKTAIDSAIKNLVDKKNKIIKLLTPAFSNTNPGYIGAYTPGVRENGGQYTHGAAWLILAISRLGDKALARELFSMLNPANHDKNIYKIEPYVIAADVYSAPEFAGLGGWSWYTGAAGWLYSAAREIFSD